MSDELEKYYADKQNCFTDLKAARDVFTSPESTMEAWHATYKGLGIMYLNCPQEIQYMAEAAMWELFRRAELLGIVDAVFSAEIPGE